MRASLLLVVLAPLVAGQYKYVFYDGDEAEYEDFNRTEAERVEVEVNEEDYGQFYDYDYTKGQDQEQEQEGEEYTEGEEDQYEEEEGPPGVAPEHVEHEEQQEVDQAEEEYTEYSDTEDGRNEEDEDQEYSEDDYDREEDYEEDYEEDKETDEETEQLYRNYEILSEFYQKHFVDLRVLDASCDPQQRPAPTIGQGSVLRYDTMDNVLLPGKEYLRAVYHCQAGFAISSRTSDSMFCQEHGWTGMEPECEGTGEVVPTPYSPQYEEEEEVDEESEEEEEEEEECSEGYVLSSSGECEDFDECSEGNGGCEETCVNKPGTHECSCPSGFEVGGDGHTCSDNDECLSNNGHGPCQDTCTNMEGYYHCSCPGIPGTRLAPDRHNCMEIDMCEEGMAGCSHTCTSSHGQAYCSCPAGQELGDDWKTCVTPPVCAEDSHLKDGECVPRCGAGDVWEGGRCVPAQVEHDQEQEQEQEEDNYYEDYEDEDEEYNEVENEEEEEAIIEEEEEEEVNDPCSPNPCGRGSCYIEGDYNHCRCPEGEEEVEGACREVRDPCDANPPPCSQDCSPSSGSAVCSCSPGFQLLPGPGGICRDIDECSLRPAICEQGCTNSPGSFLCVCNSGFTQDPENPTACRASSCSPPAAVEGGGVTCSSGGDLGSTCRLRCRPGWARQGRGRWSCLETGQWQEDQGRCAPVECPTLTLPPRLTVSPHGCAETSQSYKQKCRYSCPPGDTLKGSKVTFCGKKSKWVTRQGETGCEPPATEAPTPPPRPQVPPPPPPPSTAPPYILCPPDMKINLTGSDSRAEVRLPRPQTNVDWESGVRATPPSAKSLLYWQEPGTVEVQFTASPSSSSAGQSAVCSVRVQVTDLQPPTVTGCPSSKTVFLEPGELARSVTWTEPQFTDNVKIEHVMTSALPGSDLPLGKHLVIYQAADMAGNKEKCVFTITVVQFHQEHRGRKWVLCRVGNTGRQIRLLVAKVPPGCRLIPLSAGA